MGKSSRTILKIGRQKTAELEVGSFSTTRLTTFLRQFARRGHSSKTCDSVFSCSSDLCHSPKWLKSHMPRFCSSSGGSLGVASGQMALEKIIFYLVAGHAGFARVLLPFDPLCDCIHLHRYSSRYEYSGCKNKELVLR